QFREDEEGNFYFLDRVKDAIRRRGENISSYEVEAEIVAHPDVREVALVAVPNPDVAEETGDEEVKAVIVLEPGRELDPVAQIEFLTPRMPRYWLPRFVELVPELPRTESYKVRKADLRAAGITAGTWDRERAGVTLQRGAADGGRPGEAADRHADARGRVRPCRRPLVRVRARGGRGVSEPTVAIVGAGIYPFGRHEGVSGLAMGVEAARRALADAGIEW